MNRLDVALARATSRRLITFFLLISIVSWSFGFAENSKRPLDFTNKRILVLGDSITEKGDYIYFIEYYLRLNHLGQEIDIINMGLSGETVSGLSEKNNSYKRPWLFDRLNQTLEEIQPEIVIACYGMNDGIYHPLDAKRKYAYQYGVLKLIDQMRMRKAKLILLTPPPFDPIPIQKRLLKEGRDEDYGYNRPYHLYDKVLRSYSRWMMLQDKENLWTIDFNIGLTRLIMKRRESDPRFTLSPDGVHPNITGHLLMANHFLRAFGYEVGQEGLERQLKLIEDNPMYHVIVRRSRLRSEGWRKKLYSKKSKVEKQKSFEQAVHEVSELKYKIHKYLGTEDR